MKFTSAILFAALLSCAAANASGAGLPDPVVPDNIGVHIHFTTEDPDYVEHLTRIRASGAKFVRFGLYWERLDTGLVGGEPNYHWELYDGLIYESKLRGLTPLIVLSYWNPYYAYGTSSNTDQFRELFTRYAAAVVSRYNNRGIVWELWNEPNYGWPLSPSEYMALANRVLPEIRRLDPTGTIIAPALALGATNTPSPTDYLVQCISPHQGGGLLDTVNGRKLVDAISVHPYRWSAPDTVISDYADLRTLMNTLRPNNQVKIVNGEWGYSLDIGLSEQAQADYLARMILSDVRYTDDVQNGVPLSVWFDYAGLPVDEGGFRHFGLFSLDLRAKPAFYAMKTLTSELRGATYSGTVNTGNSEQKLTGFLSPTSWGRRGVLVAWTTGANSVVSDSWWGDFLVTNTPLYLGEKLAWNGGSGYWSDHNWTGGGWPNDWGYAGYHYNYQAEFDADDDNATIYVDGEYKFSGLQFRGNWTVLEGGILRATPGGGNLFVAYPHFNVVSSVIADANDRFEGDDPITFTNTPETFVLRKSGGGQVALLGNNTFHGTVLVGEGHIGLGSSQALGDSKNPVVLAGGGIAFEGSSVATGPFTATVAGPAIGTLGNWAANTQSRYAFPSGRIDQTITVGGGGNLELAGPISGAGGLTKIDSGALILNNAGNTYTGVTTVTAGTLAGTGGIGGDLVVTGGHIAPGYLIARTPGTFTVGGHVVFHSGGSLDIDLGSTAGVSDRLVMTGANRNLTLNGVLNLTSATSLPALGSYTIITGATTVSGMFKKVVGPAGRLYTFNTRYANGYWQLVLWVNPVRQ